MSGSRWVPVPPRRLFVLMVLAISACLLLVGPLPSGLAVSPGDGDSSPTLFVAPSIGDSGDQVRAEGAGYCESGPVTLWWDDEEKLGTEDADEQGRVSLRFTVPDASDGTHHVRSVSECGSASATFRIFHFRSDAEPVPPPALPGAPPAPEPLPPRAPLPEGPPEHVGPPSPPAEGPEQPLPDDPPAVTPGSSLDEYKKLIRRELTSGVIVYNPPSVTRVGTMTPVEVRVSREFSQSLLSGLRGPGEPRVEPLKVGTVMRARLKGDAFDIFLVGSDVLRLSDTGYLEWQWEVTPKESGYHTLYVVVSVLYGDQLIEERTFDREIDVEVNPAYSTRKWLSGNWEGAVAALVGLAGLVETVRRLRKRHIDQSA